MKKFYAEANRTLKPLGALAIYGYGLPEIVDQSNTELDEIFRKVKLKSMNRMKVHRIFVKFYKKMRPFFPPDRASIDNKYADIILPYEDQLRSVKFNH